MKKMYLCFVILSLKSLSIAQSKLELKEFLNSVKNKNSNIESLKYSIEAAEYKKESGDLGLAPVLFLSGGYLSDKKQPNQLYANETEAKKYTLGLSKKFSSGTLVKITSDLSEIKNKGLQNPLFAPFAEYSSGSLGISLTQSLLKDSFGFGTELRHQRENQQLALELSALTLQERQTLLDAEALFWDNLYLDQEVKQRESSLARATKIENWIQKRFQDGIADRADMMNAKALKALREMQLISSVDELRSAQKKLRDVLELKKDEQSPILQGDLSLNRGIAVYVSKDRPVKRIDVKVAELESDLKMTLSKEIEDSQKSDLVLTAGYNTNAYANPGSGAFALTSELSKTDTPTAQVGLVWTYMLDTDSKKSLSLQAEKEALAAKLKAQKKRIDGLSSWEELSRRHLELTKKIEAMNKVAEFQKERARAEQDKLSKGRSITSQVISSEQDASDSELTLVKLKAEQRKLESQSLLFEEVKE